MKNLLLTVILLCFCLPFVKAADQKMILISTNETDLILQVAPNGRLYQTYLGNKLVNESEFENLSWNIQAGTDGSVSTRGWEVYPCSGAEDYFEPAFAIQHNDGNMTSIFKYVSSESKKLDNNVTETIISLKDDVYPVEAKLHYVTFAKENVIKAWTEIRHMEKKPVTITQYASNMLYFESPRYVLTEFSGDWAKEVQMSSQDLKFGKKIIDTKLGSRAAMHAYPFFEIGLGAPASENTGDVLMGTIGWTGNYRFTFEVDNAGNLRVISGINPYASAYELKPNEWFVTPEFIFTLSNQGTGKASRDIHDWARNYQIKDGKGDRLTLLNNWESTGFNFNEKKLEELMKEAKHLGVDMFLLDDGWFANKYPRQNDKAGLGDWEVTHDKLPNGIPHLVQTAKDAGVMAASWAQYQAQDALIKTCEKAGIELTLFHGRGGSIGRGGAPAHAALLSQPPGSLKGGLRVTEQGEMIRFKYGLPEVTISSLSLYTSAILEANLLPPPEPKAEWRDIMAELSDVSCKMYRGYVRENKDFVPYFRSATPEQELGKLPLGSRPAKRRPTGGVESLRAIPWIFAWTQNRLMLPAWLGAGAALQKVVEGGKQSELEAMCRDWPFFSTRLGMLEMVYSKADLWLAEYYDQRLVKPELWALGSELRKLLAADINVVLAIANDSHLMADLPWIAESIQLRNIYTDPLNVLQAELLHRSRQAEEEGKDPDPRVEQALMVTIAGVAAGMRNTG